MKRPLRIAYFGTSEFAVPPLRSLLKIPELFEVAAVITQPDRPAGRKGAMTQTPVSLAAQEAGLKILKPEEFKSRDSRKAIAGIKADIFVVAAYGKIIPSSVLEMPAYGALNLHGSLLPEYRGASPIQAAIAAGDDETGVTLMLMDEKMDHGPILDTARVAIGPTDTYPILERRLAEAGAEMLVRDLEPYVDGQIEATVQDHGLATFTSLVTRQDGFVSWDNAERIERKIRAFDPWPGAYAIWMRNGKPMRLKLLKGRVVPGRTAAPGSVSISDDGLPLVATKKNGLELIEVQPEGKRPVSGAELVRGYQDLVGAVFETEEPLSDSPGSP